MSEDRHARSSASTAELLYDVNIPTPTHAERARTLVARFPTGTLCTLALEPEGYPYGSFVTVAFDEGNPVFLISGLAEHTKNLERDPRASLLVAESGADDPARQRPRHYARTVHARRRRWWPRSSRVPDRTSEPRTTLISATSRSGTCA